MYYHPNMDTISVKLPEVLRQRIAAEARRRNVSQSTIVRESVERQLAGSETGRGQVTCADLASDLVGSVRSGRKDLSTNKALLVEAIVSDAKRGRKRRC
jgi:predicted DNA-binding protein